MLRVITTCLLSLILCQGFSQSKQRLVSIYLNTQLNPTLYDATPMNNPWSVGLGLQPYVNLHSKWRPFLDITTDFFLDNIKVARITPGGMVVDRIDGTIDLFAGVSYSTGQITYVSLAGGPAFIGPRTSFGFKPSFGVYFSKRQIWTAKASYIHVYNREELTGDNYGALSFSLGLKLF